MSIAVDSSNEVSKKKEDQKNSKNGQKKKLWIAVGIMAGIIATIGIVVGVLATNDIFNDDSCPNGTYRVCGPLADGEACSCYSSPDVVLKPIIYLYPEKETEIVV